MRPVRILTVAAAALAAVAAIPAAPAGEPARTAPPPSVEEHAAPGASAAPRAAAKSEVWSHGDPTDQEQLFLELMNRARADPSAEADRLFDDYGDPDVTGAVDYFLAQRPGVEFTRAENRNAFRSYPARPPLAFHPALLESARRHTAAMIAAGEQTHQAPGEAALGPRIRDAGYTYRAVGESVYAFARSVREAHAAFAIDWGQAVPQGQTRPHTGHRDSLMNFSGTRPYVDVGVRVVTESDPGSRLGPRVVTVDFGEPADESVRYVTGVCFTDGDGDGAWDPGEGLAGVRLESAATTWAAVSSSSGGYALPVPAHAGTIEVTATGAAFGERTAVVTLAGDNFKLDFVAGVDPPVPEARSFTSAGAVPLADGASTEDAIVVPAPDPAIDEVGDVDVQVALAHPDASQVRLVLVNPAGTEVVLWDHGPALADLAGEFDTTLAADLGPLVGGPLAGTWRLRVEDDAAGGARSLASWGLTLRPAWVRTLHARRSVLDVSQIRVLDRRGPGADTLRFDATLDAGPHPLRSGGDLRVRLLRAGEEILRAGPPGPTWPRVEGTSTESASTARIFAQVSGADLDGVSGRIDVEVAYGGVVGRQSVRLRRGRWSTASGAPEPGQFSVRSVRWDPEAPGGPAIVVRGVAGVRAADARGDLDVTAGAARLRVPAARVTRRGGRLVAGGEGDVRRVVLDTQSGAFLVRVASDAPPADDSVFPVSFRLGDDTFLATEVRLSGDSY